MQAPLSALACAVLAAPVADAHGDSVVPVIAGTWAFKDARGAVTIGSGTGSSPNTFPLVLPGHPIDLSSGGGAA